MLGDMKQQAYVWLLVSARVRLVLRFVRVCDDAVPEVQLERRQVRQGTKHRSKQASKHVSKQVLNSP